MAREFLTCSVCKQKFPSGNIMEYASERATTTKKYCPRCLKERKERDAFFNTVCQIFGLKAPGPRIWTERKRLKLKYGYTDNTIIDCLKYLYEVEQVKKLSESLYLVTPTNVEKMQQWKHEQEIKGALIGAAITNMTTNEYVAPIQENTTIIKEELDPDAWLIDE